jgi:6-phosphofructokinase 2
MSIVTLTLNPALDKSTTVERLVPEHKLRCSALQTDPGGGGINVSKAVGLLGGQSTAVFPVGGANGRQLRELVEAAGIATDCIDVGSETRENLSVTETSTNLQYRFTMPGAGMSAGEAQACLDRVAALRPTYLVASGSLPPGLPEDFYGRVAALARKLGARFVLDTSGPALRAAVETEGVYLLKPNLKELSALAGVEQLAMDQVDDAAMDLINRGRCEVVLVTLGPQGALLATKQGFEHLPAPSVPKRSTVGAGDSTVGGMVFALESGRDLRECARLAIACGTAATMNPGTQLFKAEQIDRLLTWMQTYGDRYRFTDF